MNKAGPGLVTYSMRLRRVSILALAVVLVAFGLVFAPVLSKLDYGEIPSRASWQLPDRVIETLSLRPDAVVADIGAGDGYLK